ncbi:hypothetical protein BJ878DRAFT_580341 [Calycina marina]|uniref:beta-glucosidase n=1 Tax=Calycina marina TaxID=1763456 RepID=A0A9P7Z9U0_9HELO|nr:hypothetical protein BJ878DRAFT_580341 [Calycina marina]
MINKAKNNTPDWLAKMGSVSSALCELDMSMPGDEAVSLIGNTYWGWDLTSRNFPEPNFAANTADATGPCYPGVLISPTCVVNQHVNVQAGRKNIAQNISREAVAMLKNTKNALPLSTKGSFKVIGSEAENNPAGTNTSTQRSCGTGVLIHFLSETTAAAGDLVVVFVNGDSGENQYNIEGHDAAAKYSTVIVVVHTVGPILNEAWIDLPSVKGTVFADLPGQEAGDSILDILLVDYLRNSHPSYSIPTLESNYSSSVSLVGFEFFQVQDTFSEGLCRTAAISAVTLLPAQKSKVSTPVYSTAITPALQVDYPTAGFTRIWRYLYPYVDNGSCYDNNNTAFVYPTGYQTRAPPLPQPRPSLRQRPRRQLRALGRHVQHLDGSQDVMKVYIQHPSHSSWDTLAPGGSQALALEIMRKNMSIWDLVWQNWVVPVSAMQPFLFWVGDSSGNLTLACEDLSGTFEGGRASPVI